MRAPTTTTWLCLGASVLLIGCSAACWVLFGDTPSYETLATSRLVEIYHAQQTFREQDLDGNGVHDYAGNDDALVAAGLLPPLPADAPYRFVVAWGEHPEFTWIATAEPSSHGVASDRCFAVNYTATIGVSATSIPVTPKCTLPPMQMELLLGREAQ